MKFVLFLHAIECAHGIFNHLGPLSSRNFWSETFPAESNLESVAGSNGSSSCCHHSHRLLGIGQERYIDLCRNGQRPGPECSAGRTGRGNSA